MISADRGLNRSRLGVFFARQTTIRTFRGGWGLVVTLLIIALIAAVLGFGGIVGGRLASFFPALVLFVL
jgi:uncharacterized membrane protein YtjA (UPF0391 family)